MENGLITRWFLGANSGAGFYSLYDSFAAGDGDFLWVIKGGPGYGKSVFMKRIGSAAEKNGLDVEYIHCSGDPASLDGVYLPTLKTGWLDGTAPHTLDPVCFGATGAYRDLGAFCDVAAAQTLRGEIIDLFDNCKGRYVRAYDCLRAAASATPEKQAGLLCAADHAAAEKRAASAAARELPKAKKGAAPGRVTRRFLGGITCEGQVFLKDTLMALCKRIYVLDNRYGLAETYIFELLRTARERGVDVVLCPSPLEPSVPEALLFPSLSLGFVAVARDVETDFEPYRHVRLDALVGQDRVRALRPRLRADTRTKDALIEAATEALREARELHDDLEALFNPFVDLDGIRAAADAEVARVIGQAAP